MGFTRSAWTGFGVPACFSGSETCAGRCFGVERGFSAITLVFACPFWKGLMLQHVFRARKSFGKRFGVKDEVWLHGLGFPCPFEPFFVCSRCSRANVLVWKNALVCFWGEVRMACERPARASHAESGQGLALQRVFRVWKHVLGGVSGSVRFLIGYTLSRGEIRGPSMLLEA